MVDERGRFEQWMGTQRIYGCDYNLATWGDGEYQSPVTASMWAAWQAARHQPNGGAGVAPRLVNDDGCSWNFGGKHYIVTREVEGIQLTITEGRNIRFVGECKDFPGAAAEDARVPPPAVLIERHDLTGGVTGVGDWIAELSPGHYRVMGELVARGWNSCREAMLRAAMSDQNKGKV